MGGDFHAPKLELVLYEIDNGLNLIVEDVLISIWSGNASVPLPIARQYDVLSILNDWVAHTTGSVDATLQEKISAERIMTAISAPFNLKLEVQVFNLGTTATTAKFDLQVAGKSLIGGKQKIETERRHGVSGSQLFYATVVEDTYDVTKVGEWTCDAPLVGFVP